MIITVPHYMIPRTEEGRVDREFTRLHALAMRWQPEVTVPTGMERPAGYLDLQQVHAGISAINSLRMGSSISQQQLDAALDYLDQGIDYYESDLSEPYPGRNEEAARNLRELREEMV